MVCSLHPSKDRRVLKKKNVQYVICIIQIPLYEFQNQMVAIPLGLDDFERVCFLSWSSTLATDVSCMLETWVSHVPFFDVKHLFFHSPKHAKQHKHLRPLTDTTRGKDLNK